LLASPFVCTTISFAHIRQVLYGIQQTISADDEKTQVPIESKEEEKPKVADERIAYKYVIIGGGSTGYSALKEILEKEPTAKVQL
jgi:chemotaxis response regulator CheB